MADTKNEGQDLVSPEQQDSPGSVESDANDASPPGREILGHILTELRRLQDKQVVMLQGLDTKAAAFSAGLAALLGFSITSFKPGPGHDLATFFLHAALAALVAGLLSGAVALWPRRTSIGTKPDVLWPDGARSVEEDLLAGMCEDIAEGAKDNKRAMAIKGWAVLVQAGFLILAALLFVGVYTQL